MRDRTTIQGQEFYPLDLDRLPAGWSWGMVGEVATEIRSGFASGRHNADGVGVPHLRPMNIDREGRLDLSEVKSVSPENPIRLAMGDVLFNNTNSPELVGKTTAITRVGDWAFSNHMTRLRFPASVEPRFAALQLHYLWMARYFRHRCVNHVNQASINGKMLAETVPFVVAPRAEQERIVAEVAKQFTRLDSGTGALKRLEAHLRRYRGAVLKAACGASTRTPKALPAGWRWSNVSELADVGTGATPLRSRSEYYSEHGLPWVTSGALNNPHVTSASEYVTAKALAETNLTVYPKHTLLVAMYGEGKTRGKVSELLIEATTNQAIAALTVKRAMLPYRAYLKLFLQASYEDMRRSSSGGVQPNLNLRVIKSIPVPLPPLDEVESIVADVDAKLSGIDSLQAGASADLERAKRLRAAILRSAFEGRLVAPEQPARAPAA